MAQTHPHVERLQEQGFCVLPGFFSAADCRRMRAIMDGYWRAQGSPPLDASDFGFTIHPMMARMPDMAAYLDAPEILQILGDALRDDVRLVHLGARVSGPQSAQRIPWHNHYAWDESGLPRRDRLERLLIGVYVDGTNPEAGSLIALPRRFQEPLGAPRGGAHDPWPGEVRIEAPPGSVAIFDTALWHTAERGTGDSLRRLWGGHYQGWREQRPHPEDNEVNAPQIAAAKAARPRLKALLDGPDT